jgi:hypothetical protein
VAYKPQRKRPPERSKRHYDDDDDDNNNNNNKMDLTDRGGTRGGAVVEALRYKPEGCGFVSISLTVTLFNMIYLQLHVCWVLP